MLIAGPSSSGKTTFSKRLAVQLLANGRRPFPVGLDDYFVDRDKTPRDANGQYDYECLEAVDVALFNEHLLSLMAGRTTDLPHYVFKTGRRETGITVTLSRDNIIIVEGIHGLNPAHELAILRPLAEPLLLQVRHETPEYIEANRLLSFLQWFVPGSPDPVPDNSILREFIGGSIMENLRLWREHTLQRAAAEEE